MNETGILQMKNQLPVPGNTLTELYFIPVSRNEQCHATQKIVTGAAKAAEAPLHRQAAGEGMSETDSGPVCAGRTWTGAPPSTDAATPPAAAGPPGTPPPSPPTTVGAFRPLPVATRRRPRRPGGRTRRGASNPANNLDVGPLHPVRRRRGCVPAGSNLDRPPDEWTRRRT